MRHRINIIPIFGSVLIGLFMPLSAIAKDQATDDLEFVRTALLDPNVHEVVIPEGNYTINRPIVVNRDGVSLVGRGKVVITLADNSNSPVLILGNIETPAKPVHNLKVDNLILKGNRENQSMECWGGPCDTGGETLIRNNGITVRGVHQAEITNVQTLSMRSGGIVTEKYCSKLHFKGWISKDNYFDGFAGYQTTKSIIEDFESSENMGAAFSLDWDFSGNTIRNGEMNKNMDVGIFMRDSHRNVFSKLISKDSGNHAVFVSQTNEQKETAPKDNVFEDLTIDGAKGNGVHFNSAGSTGNRVINLDTRNVRGEETFEARPGMLQISRTRARCMDDFVQHLVKQAQ